MRCASFSFLFALGLLISNVGQAQTQVGLRIDHKAGQADVEAPLSVNTPAGESVGINRLEYYLSSFVLIHDGGQQTAIEEAYVLADAFVDEVHPLGEVSGVENVEGLMFNVGIDPDNNHADPASWPADHPLAPQVPSMHWGWAAGYRFVALEGGTSEGTLEIHALGDDNHTAGEMEVLAGIENGVLLLDVEADVLGFFHLLTVGSGLINHGETEEAILVCNNLANRIFRLPGAAGIADDAPARTEVVLVPVAGGTEVRFSEAQFRDGAWTLLDVLGRPLMTGHIPEGSREVRLSDLPSGGFLLMLDLADGRTTRRWIQG